MFDEFFNDYMIWWYIAIRTQTSSKKRIFYIEFYTNFT